MAQLKDLIVNGPSRFIGDVYATTFTGDLNGNANTATSATSAGSAVNDGSGNSIVDTYLKKSGGAMDLNGYPALRLKTYQIQSFEISSQNNNPAVISFNRDGSLGYLGFYEANNPIYITNNGTRYSLIHAGNIDSQSVNYATTSGSCSGNATTATKATQDGNGNIITSTYLPLSGGTINGNLKIGAIDNTSYKYLVLFRSGHFARINNTEKDVFFAFGTVSNTGVMTAEKVLKIGDNGIKYSPNNSSYYDILHAGNLTSYAPSLTGSGATGTWGISISGNAATATKVGTSTVGSSTMPVYINSGTPTAITSFPEAYLSWGGKNFSGDYGLIDAAMIPDLGACRSMFAKAEGITVQYSRDGGATWVDYGLTDTQKTGLFSVGRSVVIGGTTETGIDKSNYKSRIIVDTVLARIYTVLNKIAIYVSTDGSTGSNVTIDARTKTNVDAGNDTWVTLADRVAVNGWSG